MFVSGVPAVLPFTDPEPVGVDVPVVVDASPAAAPLAFADCFAAFSARRFCFEAEGAIVRVYVSVYVFYVWVRGLCGLLREVVQSWGM